MRQSILLKLILFLAIYYGIKYFGGEYGRYFLYGITQLVTFLHELGHALGALITGGSVEALQINQDGSGFTRTRGGSLAIILMGGYIGSALIGNLLFYIGARKVKWAGITLNLLGAAMIISAVFWFNSVFTTGLLILFAIVLFLIARNDTIKDEALMFLGMAAILYIIEDFNVGPSSDLERYAELFVIIPQSAWMYIWLGIVVILSFFNLRLIFRGNPKSNSSTGNLP